MFKRFIAILLLSVPFLALAATPVAGKNYKILKDSGLAAKTGEAVNIVEFFNYGCPACFHFEKELEAWLATTPHDMHFSRVPLSFHTQWIIFSKAYFVAKQLGVLKKVTPLMFDKIQVKREQLDTEAGVMAIFKEAGVSEVDFKSAFTFTPMVEMQLAKAKQMMLANKVFYLPTFVIAGRYKVDPSLLDKPETDLIPTLKYLLKKSKADNAKHDTKQP